MRLRFSLLNIQGLVTKRTNKLKSEEVINLFSCNDIVMFTETWTNEYSDLEFDNFTYFILNRTENKKSCKRNSGGIVIYIKK